jgi:hypothetical protein
LRCVVLCCVVWCGVAGLGSGGCVAAVGEAAAGLHLHLRRGMAAGARRGSDTQQALASIKGAQVCLLAGPAALHSELPSALRGCRLDSVQPSLSCVHACIRAHCPPPSGKGRTVRAKSWSAMCERQAAPPSPRGVKVRCVQSSGRAPTGAL